MSNDTYSNDFIECEIIAGSKSPIYPAIGLLNLEPAKVWKRWLTYISPKQQEIINKVKNDLADLTKEELDLYVNYTDDMQMVNLLKQYDSGKISNTNYRIVGRFVTSHSITKYIESKLTKEELEYAEAKMAEYKKMSNEKLKNIVESLTQEEYDQLSIADCYVMHLLDRYVFRQGEEKTKARLQILEYEHFQPPTDWIV